MRQVALLGIVLATDAEWQQAADGWLSHGDDRALLDLPGSYNVVMVDRGRLRVLTDLSGQRPIFSTVWGGSVVFASLAQPLAVLTGATCDRGWLGATLLCPDVDAVTLRGSPFTGVSRLPPGWSLVADNGSVRHEPPPNRPPTATRADAAERLRTALSTAVSRRVQRSSHPSADLSGGLDSSTISLLSAHALAPDARLPCFTYVDGTAGEDDLRHAAVVARSPRARLDHRVLRGSPDTLPYAAIHEGPLTDEPTADVVIFSRLRFRLEACRAAGSDLHLTGHGGDAVISGPMCYLTDLLRQCRWRRLIRESVAWARVRSGSPAQLLGAATRLAATSHASGMRRVADALVAQPEVGERRRRIADNVSWFTVPAGVSWFTTDLRRQVADRVREAAETQGSAPPAGRNLPGDATSWRGVQLYGAGHRTTEQICADMAPEVAAPYLDDQVVVAALSCAATERVDPFVPKPLLVDAFSELLPAQIIGRRTKGDYSPAERAGVQRHAAELVRLAGDSALESMGVLTPGALRRAVEQAVDAFPVPFAMLNDLVAAEAWLGRLRQTPSRWWSPIEEGAGSR